MARKQKSHPDLYRYIARYELNTHALERDEAAAPELFDTPEEALEDYKVSVGQEDGDVVYIYQLIAVRRVTVPTLHPHYVPETK